MSKMKLSETQTTILKAAAKRPDGNIEPLPATLKGGARQKVIEGLVSRKLAAWKSDAWVLTDAGYAVVGRTRPTTAKYARPRRTREGSKQSTIISMLGKPEGTTLAELINATGWQAHSVRGTLSIIGKTQPITSEKSGNSRVYKLAAAAT